AMRAFNHLRNPQIEYLEDLIVRKIFSSKNLTLSEELLYKRQPAMRVVLILSHNNLNYTNPTSRCVLYFPAKRGNIRARVVLRIAT
ncbi:hypothetical protein, partial [Xenorhabdus sp. GDc328]|uniref:hypothetical protein n=1 Tax=Xenorhabdus sp. GDc328 TaxID=742178 RepID=UPI001F2CA558